MATLYSYDFIADAEWLDWTELAGTWTMNSANSRVEASAAGTNAAIITGSSAGLVLYEAKVWGEGIAPSTGAPGIMFAYQDANNFYMARIHEADDEVQLYKMVAGVPTKIGSSSKVIDVKTWYVIRVEWLAADHVKVYVDDNLEIDQTTDLEAWTSGAVGLRCYNSAVVSWFDYINVWTAPPVGLPAPTKTTLTLTL